jgi:signal transduction histidine kinase
MTFAGESILHAWQVYEMRLSVPKLLRTTTFKLAISLLLVFSITAVCGLGYVVWQAGRLMQTQIAESVESEIVSLKTQYRTGGLRGLVTTLEERAGQPGSFLYLLALPNGQPFAGNITSLPAGSLDSSRALEIIYSRHGQIEGHAYAHITILPPGFRLLVGRDLGERARFTRVMVQAILGGLVLVIVLGLAGGLLVSHRIIARLNAMTATSRRIMGGHLDGRLPISGSGDEFDRLALATNGMLERISELMGELRQVTDNVAHDLKTPLTRLRNHAEEALRGDITPDNAQKALEHIIAEADRLISIFNAMLSLARLESGAANQTPQALDLAGLARDVAELYEPAAEEAGFILHVDLIRPQPVIGNRELLSQALANLFDNAIKYGKAEEVRVPTITIRQEITPQYSRIIVADNGNGIAQPDRARAMERFIRLETSRALPGTGLGLSLVQAIARLHRGELRLEDNRPGLAAVLEIKGLI